MSSPSQLQPAQMTTAQVRSPSPETVNDCRRKRLKTGHSLSASSTNYAPHFYPGLLEESSIHPLRTSYANSEPFRFGVIEKLFQDELLRGVKDECLNELSFTEKETDIYRVNQTGDLASLSYLSHAQLELLPNLLTLRDALYSQEFRRFIRAVTGCGPLSGMKQDMSVNSYTRGCHLLNHDDVIGTRRVSYILYMPLPYGQQWKEEYGGALELYPVRSGIDGVPEPEEAPSKSIPPSWNQFVFFEVQPGKSFHSVEEVVVGEEGHVRLSISGWFHAAQEGEEGYVTESPPPELKSSREQLTSSSTVFTPYPDTSETPHPDAPLSLEHVAFLARFLNPVYLQLRTIKTLMVRFIAESSLEFHHFLSDALIEQLEPGLLEADAADGLDATRNGRVPPHSAGVSGSWVAKGPPHKRRYCTLKNQETDSSDTPSAPAAAERILRQLQDELFPSVAFKAWLGAITRLFLLGYSVEARRFRPGLDYTLATSEHDDARLDVVLGLTPHVTNEKNKKGKGKAREGDEVPIGWKTGEWGGWECYMVPHNEEDDPAVYRSGSSKRSETKSTKSTVAQKPQGNKSGTEERAYAVDMDEDEEEDSTLLTVQPNFNCLLLVLRDDSVLHFVKYVSAAAAGSRWDICSEFEVGMVEEDEDEEDEQDGA